MEALLPANLFKRIHRSFIISISKIESYTAEMVEIGGIYSDWQELQGYYRKPVAGLMLNPNCQTLSKARMMHIVTHSALSILHSA